jgi:phage terminase large subunit-like protein
VSDEDEGGEGTGRGFSSADREDAAPGRRGALSSSVAALPTEWVPFPNQAGMLAVDRGIVMAIGALGSGKSEPGALKLIKWALAHPRRADGRPTKWYAIGPDFSLIRQEQFGKLLEHCRRIKVPGGASVVRRVVMGADPRIVLMHGQVILGRSATDPDRLRGHEIDGFWGDEIQKWPERAFRIAFSRTRSAATTRVVLTGSPEDRPGWNWALISGKNKKYDLLRAQLLADGAGLYVFRWDSKSNVSNQAGVLGAIRAVMEAASGENVAAQELDGRFPGTPEAPTLMGEIDYRPAFVERVELEPRTRAQAIGVDIGEVKDFTWMTALSPSGVVLAMERFNVSTPGVPRAGFYPYVGQRIERFTKKWHASVVVVDVAKAGAGVAQHLALALGATCRVIPYDTSVIAKKSAAIEIVGVAMSRGGCVVPETWTDGTVTERVEWVDYLRKELSEIAPVEIGGGRRKWEHPAGGHDDGIVSIALGYHGLSAPTVAALFRREWLRFYAFNVGTGKVDSDGLSVDPRHLVRIVTVATPPADDPTRDYTVFATLGIEPVARRAFVLGLERAQVPAHELVARAAAVAERVGATVVFARHDAQLAAGLVPSSLVMQAAAAGLEACDVVVDPDPANRAQQLAAAMSGGSLWFPGDARWLADLEGELLEFPGGPHANQVDALSNGVMMMNQLVLAAAERSDGPERVRMRL